MLKKLMISTAIGGLMIGSAAAQATPPSEAPAQPPAATTMPAPSGSSAAAATSSEPRVVNAQTPDQWLASNFRGMDVIGADDQKIGDVSDILLNRDGTIEAYIVSIGGFLGLGAKDVAMTPESFHVVPGDKAKNQSDRLQVKMTREQLEKVATFEPHRERRTTTGTGSPATGGGPAGR